LNGIAVEDPVPERLPEQPEPRQFSTGVPLITAPLRDALTGD
jgi:hypothetical protein